MVLVAFVTSAETDGIADVSTFGSGGLGIDEFKRMKTAGGDEHCFESRALVDFKLVNSTVVLTSD